jgi:hypothetical protein
VLTKFGQVQSLVGEKAMESKELPNKRRIEFLIDESHVATIKVKFKKNLKFLKLGNFETVKLETLKFLKLRNP